MSDSEIRGKSINRTDLAHTFGISLPTVDAWVRKGCPVVQRGSKGREWVFDTAAVYDWRIQITAADAAAATTSDDGRISKDEADRRKAVAAAVITEVEADEALKNVVSRFDAESILADFCQALRSALSNVGTKVAGRAATLTDPNEIREFHDSELNRAFNAAHADLTERWASDGETGDESEDD